LRRAIPPTSRRARHGHTIMRSRQKRVLDLVGLIVQSLSERLAWGRGKIYRHLGDMGWEVNEAIISRIIGELLRKGKIEPIIAANLPVVRAKEDAKRMRQKYRAPKRNGAVEENRGLPRKAATGSRRTHRNCPSTEM